MLFFPLQAILITFTKSGQFSAAYVLFSSKKLIPAVINCQNLTIIVKIRQF